MWWGQRFWRSAGTELRVQGVLRTLYKDPEITSAQGSSTGKNASDAGPGHAGKEDSAVRG